jgi:hypothetical protein
LPILEAGQAASTGTDDVLIHLQTEEMAEVECVQVGQPSEITSISFDPVKNRLVVTNRLGSVALFIIDPASMTIVRDCWAKWIRNSIPRAAAFNSKGEITVFGLHDALCVLFPVSSWYLAELGQVPLGNDQWKSTKGADSPWHPDVSF